MTIRQLLFESTNCLKKAGVELPHLDAVLLIAHAMQVRKEQVYLGLPDEIDDEVAARVHELVARRCGGVPVSYLRHKKEFYSNDYFVDERVLVPRPDTEILVEAAVEFVRERGGRGSVLDVCSGSGCIIITLAQLFPELDVAAADISPGAGEVLRINAGNILGRSVPFFESDLFANVSGSFDCIVSNPPYVTRDKTLELKDSGWPEPTLALDGGEDGTDLLCEIIRTAPVFLNAGGMLLLEADPAQMKKLTDTMEKEKYINSRVISDLGGRERVITGIRPRQ